MGAIELQYCGRVLRPIRVIKLFGNDVALIDRHVDGGIAGVRRSRPTQSALGQPNIPEPLECDEMETRSRFRVSQGADEVGRAIRFARHFGSGNSVSMSAIVFIIKLPAINF